MGFYSDSNSQAQTTWELWMAVWKKLETLSLSLRKESLSLEWISINANKRLQPEQ